jgi:hypothetical protein
MTTSIRFTPKSSKKPEKKGAKAPHKGKKTHIQRVAATFAVIDAAIAAPEGIPYLALPKWEIESICAQLKELTHDIIDAWACRGEIDSFDDVLVKLHAARLNLESEMQMAGARLDGAS